MLPTGGGLFDELNGTRQNSNCAKESDQPAAQCGRQASDAFRQIQHWQECGPAELHQLDAAQAHDAPEDPERNIAKQEHDLIGPSRQDVAEDRDAQMGIFLHTNGCAKKRDVADQQQRQLLNPGRGCIEDIPAENPPAEGRNQQDQSQ